jgi:hypothetical protein
MKKNYLNNGYTRWRGLEKYFYLNDLFYFFVNEKVDILQIIIGFQIFKVQIIISDDKF